MAWLLFALLFLHRVLAQVPSYVVSFGYVFMDTYDKTTKVKETAAPANRNRLMLETAADTLLWQTAASVVVPGFTIHRVVSATAHALRHHANKNFRKWAPTFIGLGASCLGILNCLFCSRFVLTVRWCTWCMLWRCELYCHALSYRDVALIVICGFVLTFAGVIPLIVHPIDHSVTFLMDNSTRKLFSSHQP